MKTFLSLLTSYVKSNRVNILVFLIVYIAMLSFFLLTSIGTETYRMLLHARRYIPCALGVTFALHLWRKYNLSFTSLFPCSLVFVSWFFIFNITSYLANYKSTASLNNYMDIAFSAYIFCFMVFIYIIMSKSKVISKSILSLIMSSFQLGLLFIPTLSLIYYLYYDNTLSTTAAIAILQTNPQEAWEYILQIGSFSVFLLTILLAGLFSILYKHNVCLFNSIKSELTFTPPGKIYSLYIDNNIMHLFT